MGKGQDCLSTSQGNWGMQGYNADELISTMLSTQLPLSNWKPLEPYLNQSVRKVSMTVENCSELTPQISWDPVSAKR